jgi:hypothetical protein
MDAVDYYNNGHIKMSKNDYLGAANDYTNAIYGDKSTAPNVKELEMMAYLNRGIAYYNYAIGKNKYSFEAIEKTSQAISDWEYVLNNDINSERRSQAMELISKAKNYKDTTDNSHSSNYLGNSNIKDSYNDDYYSNDAIENKNNDIDNSVVSASSKTARKKLKRVKINGDWYDASEWMGQTDLSKYGSPISYKAREPYAHISNLFYIYDKNDNKVGEIHIDNNTKSGVVDDYEV